jgi:hypothetical protein
MELIDPRVGNKLLTQVFNACKDVPGSEKELEAIEELIQGIRLLDDTETPWPVPSKVLIRLINTLPKDVELDEQTKELLQNAHTCSKTKKRLFTKKFLEEIAPDKINCCANSLCTNVDNLKKCKRCKIFSYCSIECQRLSWKAHKSDCNDIYNIRHIDVAPTPVKPTLFFGGVY